MRTILQQAIVFAIRLHCSINLFVRLQVYRPLEFLFTIAAFTTLAENFLPQLIALPKVGLCLLTHIFKPHTEHDMTWKRCICIIRLSVYHV